jgi:hypothetical protein
MTACVAFAAVFAGVGEQVDPHLLQQCGIALAFGQRFDAQVDLASLKLRGQLIQRGFARALAVSIGCLLIGVRLSRENISRSSISKPPSLGCCCG